MELGAGAALCDRFARCGIARPGSEGWPVAGGTDREGCAIPEEGGKGEYVRELDEEWSSSIDLAEADWASSSSLRFFAILR